jgi:2-polyprenyl-3-methyl-5-hydroxy-6-metoxy-1,4-benzoquinol methylase
MLISRLSNVVKKCVKPINKIRLKWGMTFRFFHTAPEFHQNWEDDGFLSKYLSYDRILFYEEILDKIMMKEHLNILDAGCGCGYFLQSLLNKYERANVYINYISGIDASQAAINRARNFNPSISLIQCSLYNIPIKKDSFHQVFCMEVLEHLVHPKPALDELMKILHPNGQLIVTIPDGTKDDYDQHNNFWNIDSFKKFVEPYRIKEIYILQDNQTIFCIITK